MNIKVSHASGQVGAHVDVVERHWFWSRIAASDTGVGCWHWKGAINRKGYGVLTRNGRYLRAHRVAYELLVGPIPKGLQLDHLCRVRDCANPDHLEPVTLRENVRRGAGGSNKRAITHCPQGHEYTEDNTYRPPSGGRYCRACKRAYMRTYKARRRAANQEAGA